MSERLAAFIRKAIVKGTRVSRRETSQPDIGKPIKELMGMVSSTEPNSASFRSKAVRMVGMREAQLEKLKPDKKKNTLKKIVAC